MQFWNVYGNAFVGGLLGDAFVGGRFDHAILGGKEEQGSAREHIGAWERKGVPAGVVLFQVLTEVSFLANVKQV